jgi:hypothetical protein
MVGWRKLHNEKLHNLYSSPNDQVKKDEMDEKECIYSFGWRSRRKDTTNVRRLILRWEENNVT